MEVQQKKQEAEKYKTQLYLKENLPHLFGYKLYKWQRDFLEGTSKISCCTAANQIGKAAEIIEEIPTPRGFVQAGNIKVGDKIYGTDGKETQVIDIPFIGKDLFYKITFDDGAEINVSQNHLWTCKTENDRFRKFYICNRGKNKGKKFPNPDYNKWRVLSTNDIIRIGRYSPETQPRLRVAIPVCEPVEYSHIPEFDPYILGIMLGDACLAHCSMSVSPGEIEDYIIKNVPDYAATPIEGRKIYRLSYAKPYLMKQKLLHCLADKKFIPDEFFVSSIETRKALLAGLLDTDGYCSPNGIIEYSTTSEKLKDGIIELSNSLGGLVSQVIKRNSFYELDGERHQCQDSYRVYLKFKFNPFRLKRKAGRWKLNERYKHERLIYKIEEIGEKDGICFTVDSPDSCFLAGKEYIVTHNSTIQIIKTIKLATEKTLWPKFWQTRPRVFWYLYPNFKTATEEFVNKWVPYILPKDKMKEHPQYGWKETYKDGYIYSVEFKTGVIIYFKTYSQNPRDLQTGTCSLIACDEELELSASGINLFDELMFRLSATDGPFMTVFTATLGQAFWHDVMELKGTEKELLPKAFKQQISLFDCMYYEDGTPSLWTEARIRERINSCSSENEVQRRIYGRFVKDTGLKYHAYERKENVVKPYKIPDNWIIYSGTDYGSGGKNNSCSSVCFVAVNPEFTKGAVFRGWLGRGVDTTAGDLYDKYKALRSELKPVLQAYDHAACDFYRIALRNNDPFVKADKSHDVGEGVLNTLFKKKMLDIFDIKELGELQFQLSTLSKDTPKKRADDDFTDALRYAVTLIPWDFAAVEVEKKEKKVKTWDEMDRNERRAIKNFDPFGEQDIIMSEIEEYNRECGTNDDFGEY